MCAHFRHLSLSIITTEEAKKGFGGFSIELREILYGPALSRGYFVHLRFGVYHHRVAEKPQHFVVGVVVGVTIGLREIEAVLGGEVLDDYGFEAAVRIVSRYAPC